ncbi:mRNA surveillance protein pelota [Candidatus Woesearchaeota archaeon]|nr:mRNA surveillance protein pelota [Candidatus Woesearchaeota archaeon]
MKILKSALRKGEVTIMVQTLDDLWYLSQVIEPGDLIKGRTLRKIQVRGKEERSSEATKKPVWITVRVESVEFHKYSSSLRASGIITEAPEEVPKAHHTFTFQEGTSATIIKQKWHNYQIKRLKEAASDKAQKTIICVFDREDAAIALLKQQGYQELAQLKGKVEKKAHKTETKNFYKEIISLLKEYEQRYRPENIILSSPSFWKEELMKELGDDELSRKIVLATCSSVQGGIAETLKRPELKEVLKSQTASRESRLVEKLFTEISKSGLASYGQKETISLAQAGAVNILLITDSLIHKTRQQGSFHSIEEAMKNTEKTGGQVHIISSENEPGKKLDSLGGIASILRYKLSW